MARSGTVGRLQAFLGLVGIAALVVTYSLLTGWNPLPRMQNWLQRATSTSLSKPAPPWTVRAGDQPDWASVLPGVIVVSADGSVEARNPGDGALLWTRTDSWAATAGDTRPVVLVGRPVGGGFDVYDAVSGGRLWSDGSRAAVWPYSDVVLILHCAHDFDCTLSAVVPTTGHHIWSAAVNGPGGAMRGIGKPFATLQRIDSSYSRPLRGVPSPAPPLVGLNLDGDIHVISTAGGRQVRVYPAKRTQRVVLAEHTVIVATATLKGDACTYTLEGRDPDTNATLWRRSGYNARTTSGLGCDPRADPQGAGGVLLATDTNGRDVMLSVGTGNVVYRAPDGARIVATDGSVVVVRSADGKRLTVVSANSGATLWSRAAAPSALVGIGPGGLMIADPGTNRLVVTSTDSGAVRVDVQSGATILGVGTHELIVNIGRSFGPVLLPGS
jgi:outer membrane protein assembly factor BamB